MANIEKREIIRGLDVESAAKRRDFRNMERKRLAKLTAENGNIQRENHSVMNTKPTRSERTVS